VNLCFLVDIHVALLLKISATPLGPRHRRVGGLPEGRPINVLAKKRKGKYAVEMSREVRPEAQSLPRGFLE
jgi:hypothetical protein